MSDKLRKEFFKGSKKLPRLVRVRPKGTKKGTGSAIFAKEGKRFIPIGRLPPRSLAQLAFIKKTKRLGLKRKKKKGR